MKLMNSKNSVFFYSIIIFILAFGIRIYWVSQKEGINGDEALSVIISSYNDYGWEWNVDYDHSKIYTGKEVKEITFWDNASIKNTFGDIRKLRLDTRDSPHTNFYYSLLRLSFAGVKTGNLHRIIIQGCILNLILFIISFFFLFLLLIKLFNNNFILAFALFVAFLNTGAISNTLLLRDYQLQETMLIVMSYIFVILYQKIAERQKIDSWQNLLLLAFPIALVLDSGYFVLIYVLLIFATLIVQSFITKQKKNISFLCSVFFSALVVTGVLYCKYYDGFIGDRGKEALGKLGISGLIQNFSVSFKCYFNLLNTYLFSVLLLFILFMSIIIIIYQNKLKFKLIQSEIILLILISLSLVWSFGVIFVAPYKYLRYIVPTFPVMSLFIVLIIQGIKTNKINYIFVGLILSIFIFNAFSIAKIENINKNVLNEQIFTQEPAIPVLVMNQTPWKYGDLVPYLNDSQNYEFVNSDSLLYKKISSKSELFLILEKDKKIPSNFCILKRFSLDNYFIGYKLKKIID